mmetsp:Transcript_8810/g.24329  ORF Transcript_8810/g.24329 Transcript_8810/m.24329 type:complete len:223 (+) Transcript_8810:90-758(+)
MPPGPQIRAMAAAADPRASAHAPHRTEFRSETAPRRPQVAADYHGRRGAAARPPRDTSGRSSRRAPGGDDVARSAESRERRHRIVGLAPGRCLAKCKGHISPSTPDCPHMHHIGNGENESTPRHSHDDHTKPSCKHVCEALHFGPSAHRCVTSNNWPGREALKCEQLRATADAQLARGSLASQVGRSCWRLGASPCTSEWCSLRNIEPGPYVHRERWREGHS